MREGILFVFVLGSGVAPGGADLRSSDGQLCSFDGISKGFYFGLVWSGPVD